MTNVEISAYLSPDHQAKLTKAHRTTAQGAFLDPLLDHIQCAQDRASRLHGVLCAIDHLDNADECAAGLSALVHVAVDLSFELQAQLDSVNLPEVRSDV